MAKIHYRPLHHPALKSSTKKSIRERLRIAPVKVKIGHYAKGIWIRAAHIFTFLSFVLNVALIAHTVSKRNLTVSVCSGPGTPPTPRPEAAQVLRGHKP